MRTGGPAALSLALCAALAAGCRQSPTSAAPTPPAPAAAGGAARPAIAAGAGDARSPLSQRELPTTSGEIAVSNFEDELQTATRLLDAAPASPQRLALLATMLLERGRLQGTLADYDRAESLAERAVALGPKVPVAWRARAMARSRLHRFEAALADWARYGELGGPDGRDEADQRRGAVLQALGRTAEARPILEKWARTWPRLETLGQLATLDGDEGRLDDAERGFAEAQRHYPNVSPFPVAWLYLQEGTMWQGAGRMARARELFEAAHERVPADAAVTSHLAATLGATGERDRAIALLRPLVARADDPEYAAQLAALLAETGPGDEAASLRARAAARYDELLARHTEAFADHAARFFLGAGGDPRRALALAERNLAVRKTPDACSLLIDAALAAGNPARACEVAAVATAAFPRVARLHAAAWKSYSACDQPARATTELQTAQTLDRTPH